MSLPPNFTLLQVVPALDTGGVEQTTIDVAGAVVAAGGRALVASRGGRMERLLKGAGGELVELPLDSKNPLVLMGCARALERLIRKEGVSIVHARSRAPAFAALRAARRTGVPFIATYHGIYGGRSSAKRWYNGVMTRGDRVIANSDFTRAHVIAEHGIDPERVVTIPRGVDLSRFDPAAVTPQRIEAQRAAWGLPQSDRRPLILLAGRLTRWKGQGLLIEALRRIERRGGLQALAVMAGDPQARDGYRAELANAIEGAGMGDRVRIAGHVEDMPAAYLAADLACAPSTRPEAFGRTAVEPQAMGRPVLAAEHGAAIETVVHGETGWLVPPNDPEAWADAIEDALVCGPRAWARMGQEGMVRARTLYSVESMCRATLDVYADVLASRARAPR